MDLIASVESKHLKANLPDFRPGDTVRVYNKIKEGDKERIQVFQGVVIQKKGSGIGSNFTVRKTSLGIGVEKVVPLHSPSLTRIEVLKKGKVRRAKLYYLRGLRGRAARIEERREESTASQPEQIQDTAKSG
jgi:large subunit ribosomal protein L19